MMHFAMKLIVFNVAIFVVVIHIKRLKVISNFVFVNRHVVSDGVAVVTLGCHDAEQNKDDEPQVVDQMVQLLTLMRTIARESKSTYSDDVLTVIVYGIFQQQLAANKNADRKHIIKNIVKKH